MNWTCLVYGGSMLAIIIWWFVSARKWFKGPKPDIKHQMLGREVLDAREVSNGSGGSSSGSITKADDRVLDDKHAGTLA